MIYICENKGCHFVFFGSEQPPVCPDCGKPHIRPATLEERAALFRRQVNPIHTPSRCAL